MRVRCVRILQGGARGAPEIGWSASIHVGGEYVVLQLGSTSYGTTYTLLRDASATRTTAWTAEMFEIISGAISPLWKVTDTSASGHGSAISLGPAGWDSHEFWDRLISREPATLRQFRACVAQLHQEEGVPAPELLEDHFG